MRCRCMVVARKGDAGHLERASYLRHVHPCRVVRLVLGDAPAVHDEISRRGAQYAMPVPGD